MASPDLSFLGERMRGLQEQVNELSRKGGPIDPPRQPPHDGGMDTRLTKLEAEFGQVRKDLDVIRSEQKDATNVLTELRIAISRIPSRGELFGYTATVAAIAFAIVAMFVAVLAYLQDQRIASKPEPMVQQPVAAAPVQPAPQPQPSASQKAK